MRSVQPLNEISDVLFGSGTLEDPFNTEENTKDKDDREKSCKQTGESQARCLFSIKHPDQANPDHK